MFSYGFVMLSYGFAIFLIDFNSWPSPDQRLSYDFPWFPIGFPMVLLCFWLILIVVPHPIFGSLMISYGFPMVFLWFCYVPVEFNRRPSPDLRLSYGFLWFCMVFQWFVYVSI